MQQPIYLDYAATTPLDPRVAKRMSGFLTPAGTFGNPGSTSHCFGHAAREAVENARVQVAALIKADPGEIVWTSGATESNNLALKGALRRNRKRGRHMVTCTTEHKAVLDVCKALELEGVTVSYLNPQHTGLIDLDEFKQSLRPDTVLASIMHVNNETGVIQDLQSIGQITRQHGVLFHVDAAQSAGKLRLDIDALNIDLLSLSAHKIYGPKGIGALYVRRRPKVRLAALIHGGGQEHGLRAGTLATHQIVGMGEAFMLADAEMASDNHHISILRQQLWQGLQKLDGIYLNGSAEASVANILNLSFAGVGGEDLLLELNNIALSSGSACSSAATKPSHVLRALGHSDELADSAIRFSLGRFTTSEEIDLTVQAVTDAVIKLRR